MKDKVSKKPASLDKSWNDARTRAEEKRLLGEACESLKSMITLRKDLKRFNEGLKTSLPPSRPHPIINGKLIIHPSTVKEILRILKEKGACRVNGLGIFRVRDLAPKRIRVPGGLTASLPARKSLSFRPERRVILKLNNRSGSRRGRSLPGSR